MKKLLFISFLVILTNFSFAQDYFILTPKGYVAKTDFSKNYIVLDYEGKSQQELYNMFLVKFTSMYVSAQNVISSVPNSTISINGITRDDIHLNQFYDYTLNYTIVFQFKDGKVRINGMSINKLDGYIGSATNYKNVTLQGYGKSGFATNRSIFDEDGGLYDEELKVQLEVFFNKLIERIIKTEGTEENW